MGGLGSNNRFDQFFATCLVTDCVPGDVATRRGSPPGRLDNQLSWIGMLVGAERG